MRFGLFVAAMLVGTAAHAGSALEDAQSAVKQAQSIEKDDCESAATYWRTAQEAVARLNDGLLVALSPVDKPNPAGGNPLAGAGDVVQVMDVIKEMQRLVEDGLTSVGECHLAAGDLDAAATAFQAALAEIRPNHPNIWERARRGYWKSLGFKS